jgi:serine/threonine protein phosphatase PrpC
MICYVRQLCKGQDHAIVEENIDLDGYAFDSLSVFDGHGLDTCINTIRKLPLTEIMKNEKAMDELNSYLYASFKNFSNSGSTCILTKVYSDHILIEYVGDSQIAVFIDSKCAYLSIPHNLENSEEYERVQPLLRESNPIEITKKPALVSTTRVAMVPGNMCYFTPLHI